MSSFDRLIVPAYTSPVTGTRTEWKYRAPVNEAWDKRIDSYDYVDIDGTEHRELGINGAKYPMECVFDGVDHDQDARDFLQTLREKTTAGNPGFLEHPRLGVIPVVVASVDTAHDPRGDSGETIVNVDFWEQLTLPSQQQDSPVIATRLQLEASNTASQNDFENTLDASTDKSKLSAILSAKESLAKVSQNLAKIASKDAQVMITFSQIESDILNNIDTIIKTPATLASQFQQMIQIVMGVPATIKDKAEAWKNLYFSSVGSGDTPDSFYSDTSAPSKNEIAFQELVSTSAISSMLANIVLSMGEFKTKQEAFNALQFAQQNMLNLGADLDALQFHFEDEIFQKGYFSNTESYKNLAELSRISTLAIQRESSKLKTTMFVKLLQDATLLEIAFKYYNDVSDEVLDFIIDSNELTVEEILLLTQGKTIQI